jgi:uncharacterized protein (TIGR02246 family)
MDSTEIEAIVQDIETKYAAAFCNRDGKALAALCTEKATALSEWGDVMQGREEFEQKLGRAFANIPGDLQAKLCPTYCAAITEDVIIVHGTAHKSLNGHQETLYYTRVLVKQADGVWRIAAVQVAPRSALPDPRVG